MLKREKIDPLQSIFWAIHEGHPKKVWIWKFIQKLMNMALILYLSWAKDGLPPPQVVEMVVFGFPPNNLDLGARNLAPKAKNVA